MTAFLTVCAILLFYDTLFGRRVLLVIGRRFLEAVQPILYGAMIAYLLAPVVNFFERVFFETAARRALEQGRFICRGARAVSLVLTWIVICFCGYVLASVLLPELYRSVVQLVGNVETYYRTVSGWVEHLLETNPAVENWVTAQMDNYFKDISSWLTDTALPQAQTVMTALSGGVVSTLLFAKNLLVGIIVSVYLLATKERCAAHSPQGGVQPVFPGERPLGASGTHKVDTSSPASSGGKLFGLPPFIGVICFVGCSVLKFPIRLVSVIVGVTNVIPFFGPFLGAIPARFSSCWCPRSRRCISSSLSWRCSRWTATSSAPKFWGTKPGFPASGSSSPFWWAAAFLVCRACFSACRCAPASIPPCPFSWTCVCGKRSCPWRPMPTLETPPSPAFARRRVLAARAGRKIS